MNSFNHYAFGAVGEYLVRGVGGIRAASPGYRTIVVQPAIPEADWHESTQALNWANTSFKSMSGNIVSNWKLDGDRLTLDVEIPPNTTAEVHVPTRNQGDVTEGGAAADRAPGVRFLRMENGAAVYAVGSGKYTFASIR
jgi:alpha-L-rhamnosidase